MKTTNLLLPLLLVGSLLMGQADHVLFQRVVITPTNGEFVALVNPTGSAVDLSDYYLTDATKASSGKYYYKLPSGIDYWNDNVSDFIARFPAGQTLAAGDTLILGLHNTALFTDYYGTAPDLSLFEDMRNAVSDSITIGLGINYSHFEILSDNAEVLILFYWDGSSATVQDVDYLLWGSSTYGVDKTGVSGYADDTPLADQVYLTPHDEGYAFTRLSLSESGEVASGGNGITGHDETSENLTSSWMSSVYPEVPEVTIAYIRENIADYIGETITIPGVIVMPAGRLRSDYTEGFLQDNSGKGIILYKGSLDTTSFHRGDSVLVTGEVDEYSGKPELVYSDITLLKSNVELPAVELNLEQFKTLEYNYTYVEVWGQITARSEPTSTNEGVNITLQDETGETTTLRIWNSTEVLYDAAGAGIVNPELDSLLQIGTVVTVRGIGGEFSSATQVQPGYADEITEKQEGEEGDFDTFLEVAPYPFVPRIGESIAYEFRYPDNARIKLRVFDAGGRHVTTLYDELRSVSYKIIGTWNGRDEVNAIVPPGIYLLHLEVTDITTGRSSTAMAPVVVGVYGK